MTTSEARSLTLALARCMNLTLLVGLMYVVSWTGAS